MYFIFIQVLIKIFIYTGATNGYNTKDVPIAVERRWDVHGYKRPNSTTYTIGFI